MPAESNIYNAKITKVSFTNEDHGVLTCWVEVAYTKGCQGFGGYTIFSPKTGEDVAGYWIWNLLKITDQTDLNKVIGNPVRLKLTGATIGRLGHFIEDIWFDPTSNGAAT